MSDPSTNVPFRQIENTDLAPLAVVAQCLDNQWVPRDLLADMIKSGWSLTDHEVTRRRLELSRHEYLRSILNAQQVIINRAFFFNNPTVYRDFLKEGPQRSAFLDLLGKAVLVPFLLQEVSPVQPQRFTVDSDGWRAWTRVAAECGSSCLRLSWDDDENAEYFRQYMLRPFRRFLLSMADFEVDGLQRDFGLTSPEAAQQMMARLREVARWAIDSETVNREEFYKKFVVADDTNPADGWYDRAKSFAGQLKQLVDLRYNSTLADAVDRYSLTPVDSLHRAALQEERQLAKAKGVEADTLLEVLLRRRAFDLVQNALDVGLTGLDLHHVWAARRTDEWDQYTASLKDLIENPVDFSDRGQEVYSRYVELARRLGAIVGDRHRGVVDRWEPVIQLTVETLGSVITVVFGPQPHVEVIGKVATGIAVRASTAVVRFAVVGRDQRRASSELGTSMDLMRVRLARTGEAWEFLQRKLAEAGLPVYNMSRPPEADANFDVPEEVDEDD
jgi:lambda repressor-like predicted transcriptional regulator